MEVSGINIIMNIGIRIFNIVIFFILEESNIGRNSGMSKVMVGLSRRIDIVIWFICFLRKVVIIGVLVVVGVSLIIKMVVVVFGF